MEQIAIHNQIPEYPVYGASLIHKNAVDQMNNAMRLPIVRAGALMPDAHVGYGVPIGGVLATDPGTIIPWAVGMDIACRMCMTVFHAGEEMLKEKKEFLIKVLKENTVFGLNGETKIKYDDSLFDRQEWNEVPTIRKFRDRAWRQLGTSGTGNHFVEWGFVDIKEDGMLGNVKAGKYLALLSHSGSRGFGGELARHYSGVASKICNLPHSLHHLAWLELDQEEGREYWIAMNLAGDYASANHHEIHNKIIKYTGFMPVTMIENHHNFAWKEKLADSTDVLVHRKGATPAHAGALGIIPGSMATACYIVKGKGDQRSINSAAHGAGRVMSRGEAFRTLKKEDMKEILKKEGIDLTGSDLDESPVVYKDIDEVMAFQKDLVETLGLFFPKIVRMADSSKRERPED